MQGAAAQREVPLRGAVAAVQRDCAARGTESYPGLTIVDNMLRHDRAGLDPCHAYAWQTMHVLPKLSCRILVSELSKTKKRNINMIFVGFEVSFLKSFRKYLFLWHIRDGERHLDIWHTVAW